MLSQLYISLIALVEPVSMVTNGRGKEGGREEGGGTEETGRGGEGARGLVVLHWRSFGFRPNGLTVSSSTSLERGH